MSELVEEKIRQMLGDPTESPYGTPIPRMDDEGRMLSSVFLNGVVRAVDAVASGEPVTAPIRRLGEPVQFDPELLGQLREAGLVPGNVVTLTPASGYVLAEVSGFGAGLELPREVAAHIFVAA